MFEKLNLACSYGCKINSEKEKKYLEPSVVSFINAYPNYENIIGYRQVLQR